MTRPVLEALPRRADRKYGTTLITNGLRLLDDLPWLAAAELDRAKVSLHYFSDESMKVIAGGKPGDVDKIKRAVEAAVRVIPSVELNVLIQEQNQHEIASIIDYAQGVGANVQLIELVDTDHNSISRSRRVDSSNIIDDLRRRAQVEHTTATGTGQGKRMFELGRISVDVIDASLPRYHVGQCATCAERSRCVEGFWSLRLDAAGTLSPCLLRPDLRLNVSEHLPSSDVFAKSVIRHIDAFADGVL